MIILIPKQTHNIYSTFVPKVSLSLSRLFYSLCVCVWNWFFVPHVSDGGYVPFFGFPFTDNPGRPPTSSTVLRTRRAQPKPPQIHSSALEARYLSCTLSLSLCSFFLFLIFWEMIRCVRTCYLEQLNFVSVLMEVQTVCMMKCLCSLQKKTPPMFEPGLFLLWYIYFFPLI